ncbi:NAD(P)H-hydrate dehydratase [Rhodococcus sp. HNM0563]|uniref:NAD(P)H-hydrate dehydratase n=1 Tax=unclassified Rhodococcus (in: high G+C Gram-positive bacteria) TaxID=192944 RepID=UPI00146E3B1A|nr:MULTISPECIES: NAD(P)H-hydrate dehydratase [unclassified Rhodococcus (in: high G+C Gram-positive bacteria)]MCK0093304.1 NAD(P)H-hydrate dehydratase [Rhodococcus sp. F64268]NLU60707.1 NAD(P)H-hydrate dehydratase [Rhodococcus sp. HNM0563]
MRSYHPCEQVRAAEAKHLAVLPEGTLMRRAAFGLARLVAEELRARTGAVAGRTVTLLVGSGDNGGDALWAGAFLRRRGVAVTALLLAPDRAHPAGLAALRAAGGRTATATPEHLGDPDLVLDGIVGISGRGPLRPAAAVLVDAITAPIVAVDTPSGVDPDTGAIDGPAVTAALTVTFGARKPVHVLAPTRCGRVELIDIGLDLPPSDLVAADPAELGAIWPVPGADDDKYSQGVVGIVAGSARYPGAAVLCTGAAVAATSGMVRYVGSAGAEILAHYPEVVAAPTFDAAGRVQAWVVGPGGGTDARAENTLRDVLSTDLPVVVDADGLTILARNPSLVRGRAAPTLLTPHAGEFARLTGNDPQSDRLGSARSLAADLQVHVLLKGRTTLIARPDGHTFVNDAGGSWASTAGAGDLLAGVVGALVSSGMPIDLAAAAGARAHSLAANLAARGEDGESVGTAPVSASTIAEHLRAAVRILRTHASES